MEIPRKIRKKQLVLVSGLMLAVFLVAKLFLGFFRAESTQKLEQKQSQKIELPKASEADLQSLWVQELEGKNKELAQRLNQALNDIEQQKQDSTTLKEELGKTREQWEKKLEQQNTLIQKKSEVENLSPYPRPGTEPFAANAFSHTTPVPVPMPIVSHNFKLVDSKKVPRTQENTIPAGSFVDAVILGGMDAAAGVSSQSEPRPVLLRLIDLSVLPNRVRKDIRDCHVIAAGFGDISSERAYIRSERLSCTLHNGNILEQKIEAYIAGEDGKDGVRGTVVRRESDLIFNSFLAGTLSGIGKGMSQAFGTTSISPLGSTKTNTGSEVFKSGLYGGAGEGGDQLQKYFIQRAEQMHPIIQISAGRTVTVVFLKGVELDVKTKIAH